MLLVVLRISILGCALVKQRKVYCCFADFVEVLSQCSF